MPEQQQLEKEKGTKDRPNTITEEQFHRQLESGNKDFSHSTFNDITFSNCSLDGCDFSNSTFNNCQFVAIKTAQNVNFRGTKLSNCKFEKCEYVGADFKDAIVSGCLVSDVAFENSEFSNAHFNDKVKNQFTNTSIIDSELTESQFTNTKFEKCYLSKLRCKGSDFRHTQLQDTAMIDCDFTDAKMAQSTIEKGFIVGNHFDGADFTAASMSETQIKNSAEFLTKTNFAKATIKNSIIEAPKKNFHNSIIIQSWVSGDYLEKYEPDVASKERAKDKSIRRPGNRYITQSDGTTKKEPRVSPEEWTDLQEYQFIVDTDIKLYGKVQDDTKEFLAKMGYRIKRDGSVVKGQRTESTELTPRKERVAGREKREDKLPKKVLDKLSLLTKNGNPIRVCPNGQVYIAPEQLELFTPEELRALSEHYRVKALTEFKRDPKITELPGNIWNKIRYMQQDGANLTVADDGRVTLPLLSLHFFKNNEIATIQSYYQNRVPAIEQKKTIVQTVPEEKAEKLIENPTRNPQKQEATEPKEIAPLPATTTRKFAYLKKDGCPMRVCPNGQVYIDPGHLRYFTRNELQEINRFYGKQAEHSFVPNRSVHYLSDELKEKLKMMEQMTGKKLVITASGKATLPTQALPSFTDDEIAELNSYFSNHPPQRQAQMAAPRMAALAPEP